MIASLLIDWYASHRRELPWRETNDPYKIWISEIILQQTRIAQGLSYYLRFIEHFPDVKSLAESEESEVLKYWQGLGYYSRARNLHATAQTIVNQYKGEFPADFKQIKALKGIGDYTAAAIASIAFKLPYAAVDGNVYRVLSRLFEIKTPIDSTKGKKEFFELAQELLDKKNPHLFNQAMMDLGAMICLPTNPICTECPLQLVCMSKQNGNYAEFPIKEKKTKQKDRYFLYLLLHEKGKIYLHHRTKSDIWKGLYEFPMVELNEPLWEKEFDPTLQTFEKEFRLISIENLTPMPNHILSHQVIHSFFIEAKGELLKKEITTYIAINENEIENYAIPRLVELYLEKREKQHNKNNPL
jgi:A/G-specific adenine glycosylase